MNPLLNAGMAEYVIFRPGDALGLARNDADARAGFKLLETDAAFAFGHAHLFRSHKRRNETLLYWPSSSSASDTSGSSDSSTSEVGPGNHWRVSPVPGSNFQTPQLLLVDPQLPAQPGNALVFSRVQSFL